MPCPPGVLCRYTSAYAAGEQRRGDVHLKLAFTLDVSGSMGHTPHGFSSTSGTAKLDIVLDCMEEICRQGVITHERLRAGSASTFSQPPAGTAVHHTNHTHCSNAVLLTWLLIARLSCLPLDLPLSAAAPSCERRTSCPLSPSTTR